MAKLTEKVRKISQAQHKKSKGRETASDDDGEISSSAPTMSEVTARHTVMCPPSLRACVRVRALLAGKGCVRACWRA